VAPAAADRQAFARRCEDLAAAHLGRLGWRILGRNVRAGGGELDIVAADGRELVFVEVKGKRGGSLGYPQEMMHRAKLQHLVRAALGYLETAGWRGRSVRFDLISVLAPPGREPALDHLRNAFSLDDL
jgi:putative endonuclease